MNQFNRKTTSKQGQLSLKLEGLKQIEVDFDGGAVCSDGGLLLLRKADQRLELSELAALCVGDKRRPDLVKHKLVNLFRQRIYGIAAGYEDCNDATRLRFDAMHRLALGYEPDSDHLLASQPSLFRFEHMADTVVNAALQRLLVHTFIRRHKRRPTVLRLSMDTTCDETHGYQQMTFYNGFYETDCYTPLFIFTESGFPLAAVLRPGNAGPAESSLRTFKQVVHELRLSWPGLRIELTADAGFAIPELFEFCESQEITYFIGTKGHSGLYYHSENLVRNCRAVFQEFNVEAPAVKKYGYLQDEKSRYRAWRQKQERIRFSTKQDGRMQEHFEDELCIRDFCEFTYASREWSRERRFIARCEFTKQGPDVRYIVTNAAKGSARKIYEEKYCPRAQCENWIKDLKNYLKCDRTSCQEFDANQFRLLLHTFAYVLLWDIKQRAGLNDMTAETLRLHLLKIGVLVKETARKVTLHLASHFPWQNQFVQAWTSY